MPTEKTYYEGLREKLAGNESAWSGVFDSQEQADQASKEMTRTLFGSLSKESKAANISGRGRIMSRISGMGDLLTDIQDYIGQLAIDDKDKAREFIYKIIAGESEKDILKSVVKVLAVMNNKILETHNKEVYLSTVVAEVTPVVTEEGVAVESTLSKKLKSYLTGFIENAKENRKYLDFTTILLSAVPVLGSVAMIASLEASGILRRTPELTKSHACLVGAIPLQHIREIEVARSGQKLKFRATGSVFLAKQEGGGTDAVRISGKFYRDEIAMLMFLLMLYEYGAARVGDIDLENPDPSDFNLEAIKRRKNILTVNTDKIKPSYEKHNTFPFVSRHVIIPNCYMETLSFEERIENGMSVVNYDILLRTFNKQNSFKIWGSDDPDTKYVYVATVYNEKLKFHQMFEYGINAIWRHIQAEAFVINTGSWKVGVTTSTYGSPQARDVYYNVDALDVASTFAMGVFGFAGKNYAISGKTDIVSLLGGVAT